MTQKRLLAELQKLTKRVDDTRAMLRSIEVATEKINQFNQAVREANNEVNSEAASEAASDESPELDQEPNQE